MSAKSQDRKWLIDFIKEALTLAHAEGKREGIEAAAKLIENDRSPTNEGYFYCYPCDCCGEVPQEKYPEMIRSLLPRR